MKSLSGYILKPLAVVLICFSSAQGQTQPDSLESIAEKVLKVYIDCDLCGSDDFDYIRTEIAFVNYVRDRKEAQVHLLITTQESGSGGTEFTITFIGQHEYAGNHDTLKYISKKDDTDDIVRQGNVRVMKLGLIRYVAKTPQAEQIVITHNKPAVPQKEVVDKWNYWVFNLDLNSFLNGQKSTSFVSLYGVFSANRVTPAWKINLSVNGNYYESNFAPAPAACHAVQLLCLDRLELYLWLDLQQCGQPALWELIARLKRSFTRWIPKQRDGSPPMCCAS